MHTLTVAPGTYRLVEIAAPWGYLISTEEKVFVINPNDEITIKFDNRERPALEIIKIDEAMLILRSYSKNRSFIIFATISGEISELSILT